MTRVEYTSQDGFKGVLYGEHSMAIFDKTGKQIFHTGFRAIDTLDELKEFVDNMPIAMRIFLLKNTSP